MGFYIGINGVGSEIDVYNDETYKTTKLEIKETNFTDNNVEEIFKEISFKLNGKIEYICIRLHSSCNNKIRKKIVEIGKKNGFLNIEFIDRYTALYLCAIQESWQKKPQNDDVIWILLGEKFYIWKKINNKASFIKSISNNKASFIEYISGKPFLKERNLKKIKSTLVENEYPNIFIYDQEDNNFRTDEIFNIVFPECKIFMYEYDYEMEGALIKAEIAAGFHLEYNTNTVLDIDVKFRIQNKTDYFFHEYFTVAQDAQSLPIEMTMEIESFNKETNFEVFLNDKVDEIITLPSFKGNYAIKFTIDANRIYSLTNAKYSNLEIYEHQYLTEKNAFEFPKMMSIPKDNLDYASSNVDIVGIDLGTTRCCTAVGRQNQIKTVAIDNNGERLLPSFIAYDEIEKKCGQIVVNRLNNYAKHTVFDSKRIIGKLFHELKIDQTWTFEVINKNDKAKIRVQGLNELLELHPEEVSATLLKHIKVKVEEYQRKQLDEVIITVPASFTENQKKATYVAGMLAGWKEVYLLPEPIAASITYFIDRPIPADKFNVILFDLGGGTLDICIFNIDNKNLQIVGNGGDANLGGRDFDNILFNHFKLILKEKCIDVQFNNKLKYRLMQKCIEIKHNLSNDNIYFDTLDISEFCKETEEFIQVSIAQFEIMSKHLLEKIRNIIMEALENANYISPNIHKVLLVGGGCRMPMIKQLLQTRVVKKDFPGNSREISREISREFPDFSWEISRYKPLQSFTKSNKVLQKLL